MALWTFNDLLEKIKLDPERVYLMRHQDTRKDVRRSNYRLWRDNPKKFKEFERWQGRSTPSKKGFPENSYMAAFVVDSSGSTLFVGLSRVAGISGYDGGAVIYNLETDNRLKDYEGLLVVEWGPGQRAWVQRAHSKPKPVIELRKEVLAEEWPGYMKIRINDDGIRNLAPNWQEKLSAVNGVYILTCMKTGEQYVGAAYGVGGFLGRWWAYADGGDGGNKLLHQHRRKISAPLQIAILEVFGSAMTEEEAYKAESRWKEVLGSRAHGLNAN
ncbi:MAG: GIY-YIG nuclease family protein [Hyphomicrobiales bacterium]|nr:GIY-YIG nuclease family protein [Hyphomicrobiales bacterium]MCY4039371.1 GIY-YIG nuclease family protein [Hyphomicrobiales bacterium]